MVNTGPGYYAPGSGYGYATASPPVVVVGGARRYAPRQEVVVVNSHLPAPVEEPFDVTGLSVVDVEERGRGVWYYKILITTADCNWEVWRRYNQFDELRRSVSR